MTLKEMIGDPSPKDLRVFGSLQVLFFSLISWTILRHTLPPWAITAIIASSIGLGVTGLIRPQAIRWFYTGWMVAVFPIGWTVSHLAMALVYWLVVTPIGIWMRNAQGDPMQRDWQPDRLTYWEEHQAVNDVKRYFRQF